MLEPRGTGEGSGMIGAGVGSVRSEQKVRADQESRPAGRHRQAADRVVSIVPGESVTVENVGKTGFEGRDNRPAARRLTSPQGRVVYRPSAPGTWVRARAGACRDSARFGPPGGGAQDGAAPVAARRLTSRPTLQPLGKLCGSARPGSGRAKSGGLVSRWSGPAQQARGESRSAAVPRRHDATNAKGNRS